MTRQSRLEVVSSASKHWRFTGSAFAEEGVSLVLLIDIAKVIVILAKIALLGIRALYPMGVFCYQLAPTRFRLFAQNKLSIKSGKAKAIVEWNGPIPETSLMPRILILRNGLNH